MTLVTTETKGLLQSRTFWLNLLVALAAVGVEVSNLAPDLGIDPKWVLFAVAILNILLRVLTTQPVTIGSAGTPPANRP